MSHDRPNHVSDTGPGSDRAVFMQRVREVLGRHPGQSLSSTPPEVDDALVRLATKADDLIALFAQRGGEVGMHVQQITRATLTAALCERLTQRGIRSLVAAAGRFGGAVVEAAERAGAQVIDWHHHGGHDAMFDVDAGVTDVDAAIAETGSLVMATRDDHARGLSLVPGIHIALVGASHILPDMLDYWVRRDGLSPDAIPSNQVFITGPSKTADIEGVLVTGVHGPGEVWILIITDE